MIRAMGLHKGVQRFLLRVLRSRPIRFAGRYARAAVHDVTAAELAQKLLQQLSRDPERAAQLLIGILAEHFRIMPPAERSRLAARVFGLLVADPATNFYAQGIFASYRRRIEEWMGGLDGLRILEIGPGYSLSVGLLFYCHGASRYVAIDRFPCVITDAEVYRDLRNQLQRTVSIGSGGDREEQARELQERFDQAVDLSGAEAHFAHQRVAYLQPVDAEALDFADGAFDVVLSNAVLEHVNNPVATVREFTRVLRPGGVGIHQIDFRDHRDFEYPWDFLRYTEDDWLAMHEDRRFQYTNRFRKSDFEREFEYADVTLEQLTVDISKPLPAGTQDTFHPDFRVRPTEDLEALSALFVVRRFESE